MLINLTNHLSSQWDEKQLKAAEQFGKCIDMPFPVINPNVGREEIETLANRYMEQIEELAKEENANVAVHLMGEMTFTFALANKLKEKGISCVASTSQRVSIDMGNGQKSVQFKFVQFREYF